MRIADKAFAIDLHERAAFRVTAGREDGRDDCLRDVLELRAACPYISPTGLALLCGAVAISLSVACLGALRRCRRRRGRRLRSSASLASLRSLRSVATHRGPVKSPSIASFHYSIASSADRRKANHGSSASLASLGSVATHRSVASPSLVSIHAHVHSTSPNHRERGGKEKYVRLLSD